MMNEREKDELFRAFDECGAGECIGKMFELTDEAGDLYIPASLLYEDGDICGCRMHWDREAADSVREKFLFVSERIHIISAILGENYDEEEVAKKLDPEDYEFWKTYLRPLSNGGMDPEKYHDVALKADNGEELTPEESAYIRAYEHHKVADAESRLNEKEVCCELITRAQRLFRLLLWNDTPDVLIQNEAKCLAATLAINQCGSVFYWHYESGES